VPDAPAYEQLRQLVGQLTARVVELEQVVAEKADETARVVELERIAAGQADETAELRRRSAADSSNSSRPPCSDEPWSKKPAKRRSSRTRPGRKPGRQPGASSSSRGLADDADQTLEIRPDRCQRCGSSLDGAGESARQRRQVVDARPAPPPKATECQRASTARPCRGAVTTPGWDDAAAPGEHAETVAAPGSPARIGPRALARAALLACARYLPVGRARDLLEALASISVSTGFLAGIRGRAARRWEKQFPGRRESCSPAPRCRTPARPPAAPPARWPARAWPARSTSP
jgi:transposase